MTLEQALDVARRELLDLGLRNPLLNYRPLKARGAEIVSRAPAEVFQLLVTDEKKMTILSGGGADESLGGLPGSQMAIYESLDQRPRDLFLRTNYTATQLQARLLATYHAARTSIEEQGVNTLYLALGMLCWYEDDQSEKVHRAPLILIPVELERSDSRDRFHLSYSGEELVSNVSLAEKLKAEFGFKGFPELSDADDLNVESYFEEIGRLITSKKRWAVERNVIALGFFSFAKLLMYRDLDPTTWKTPDKKSGLLDHEILQRLMGESGFTSQSSNYDETRLLDDQLDGRPPVQIVDADSSQTLAILDAMDGRNMVIQGPPGTGKSQTIVNLIAAAIADGKKVLFVAEKMAALDVVKRRLDAVGLGRPCLVMHGTGSGDKTRSIKRKVIDDLKSTVQSASGASAPNGKEAAELAVTRQKLNAYCSAVNSTIGETGETPCSAYGKLLEAQEQLKESEIPVLKIEAAEWSLTETRERQKLIVQLQDRLARCGIPRSHPFWGSKLEVLLPSDRDAIGGTLRNALESGGRLDGSSAKLAEACGVGNPANRSEAQLLAASAAVAVKAPPLTGVDTESGLWLQKDADILAAIRAGQEYRALHREYTGRLTDEAWTRDVQGLSLTVQELGTRWWRFLSPKWRKAQAEFAGLCVGMTRHTPATQLELLNAIARASNCQSLIALAGTLMQSLFGSNWQGLDSDWDSLQNQANWTIEAHQGIQATRLLSWCVAAGTRSIDKAEVNRLAKDVQPAISGFDDAFDAWQAILRMSEVEGASSLQAFAEMRNRWNLQLASIHQLQSLVGFNQVASEVKKAGLGAVVNIAETWADAAGKLVPLFERARLSSVLERAFHERPALAAFDGADHQRTVHEFRRLDRLELEANRALLATKCAQLIPIGGGTGAIGVLWREFEKKRKLLPIRQLMESAGQAVQSIKPVFMMSPLSIANYVPPGCLAFDLIIFDEASQVRPVDALGAVVRGKQVVVVGDSKQLPPTSFFDSLVTQDETDEEEGDQPATSDIESILGLFSSRGAHQRMLRWHYRSRHESLIAVSNHLFYDDGLVVFPSPSLERKTVGLVYRKLQHAFYDRSRTRTNPEEAKAVATAVMEHAKAQIRLPKPQRDTLGVAAFSVAQMDAIRSQLELMRKSDPSCEEFFAFPPHEPFFVKNLENVQGDERDVIFISIGYGRTAEGFLAMNFGPLNRDGGERRMNVLISRARKRCEVFTSLSADDIDLSRGAGGGVAALKTFLQYAQTGQIETSSPTGRAPDSDFEEQVMHRLATLGHIIQPQVGCAGFFLDLAVVDPMRPGRYLLGIECDGARYHSARSARDRDRLRQHVLEGLGWRIHRIWSTDWFRDPDGELRKVVREIELAQVAEPIEIREPGTVQSDEPAEVPSVDISWPAGPNMVRTPPLLYEFARLEPFLGGRELHEIEPRVLAQQFAKVVATEGPVHWREASRRLLSGAGVQRMGNRIESAFLAAIKFGVSQSLFLQRGDFLWNPGPQGPQTPAVRDRSNLPAGSRKLDLIAPEEIQKAILTVIEDSFGVPAADIPVAVCRRFGFSQTTEDMRKVIQQHCDNLLSRDHLQVRGINLTVTK